MLIKLEGLVNLLFIKLLEKKINFYFVNSVIQFLENPHDESLLQIVKFCKANYDEFGIDMDEIKKELISFEATNPHYQQDIIKMISNILSDYSYTFKERNGSVVQSSLIFLYLQLLPEECMKEMLHFICNKEMSDVLSRPQICGVSSSYIFSSIMHHVLEKGWDNIALKLAMNMQNKHLLFVKNMDGIEPLEIAMQNNCQDSFNYLSQLKQEAISPN